MFYVLEFRDCFSLYAKEKFITSTEQLTTIMRSLAFSPTSAEVNKYFTDFSKGEIEIIIMSSEVNTQLREMELLPVSADLLMQHC